MNHKTKAFRGKTLLEALIGGEEKIKQHIQEQGTQLRHGNYRILVGAFAE